MICSSSLRILLMLASVAAFGSDASGAEVSIRKNANGSLISVSVHPQVHAGAIDSLIFRGVQYVDNRDHGRQIQTAVQVDGLGECLNPTEAGSKADGEKQSTSSVPLAAYRSRNVLTTKTRAAFWLAPSEPYGRRCGMFRTEEKAQNKTVLSRYTIARTTRFYGAAIANLLLVNVTVTMPEKQQSVVVEGLTGYLPAEFHNFYSYDPRSHQLQPLSAGTTEHWVTTAIIISTKDGHSAMGVFSPQIWKGDPTRNFYSYFYYSGAGATAKWSCRFGEPDVRAGEKFNYSAAIAVGSVPEVTAALDAFVNSGADSFTHG